MDTSNEVACPVGARTLSAPTSLFALRDLLKQDGSYVNDQCLSHDIAVTGAACDSRCVEHGNIFFCKGASFTLAYLTRALEAGAAAYVCMPEMADELAACAPATPALITSNMRHAMACLSAAAFGHPDLAVPIVGITGTKGKSTSSYMLRSIIDTAAGASVCGIIGSIDTYDGVEHIESKNTTPEAPDLWRHLTHARTAQLVSMVMEVSSQALKYDRTLGVSLDITCFLNIETDHISPVEHPSFEDYFTSKLKIFSQCRRAVVNLGTEHLGRVPDAALQPHSPQTNPAFDAVNTSPTRASSPELITVSAQGPDPIFCEGRTPIQPDIWASDIVSEGAHLTFVAHSARGSWSQPCTISFLGLFNVENALVAIACAELMGIAPAAIAAGLATCQVPGRMELIGNPDGRVICLVDYAHNALSYQKFFAYVTREFPHRSLIALIGAPGGKAYERRRELPREAARWASHIVITEEDPGHDSNEDICREMDAQIPPTATLADSTPVAHEYVRDRQQAIERCLDIALTSEKPALICLLGKGNETLIHRGNEFQSMEPDGVAYRRITESRGLVI